MPFLQSSGPISIANLNGFFPGSGTSMSNFYRGGGRVPTTKTVTVVTREPSSGYIFQGFVYSWLYSGNGQAVQIFWPGGNTGWLYGYPSNPWSLTFGNVTYYRATASGRDKDNNSHDGIYRTVTSSSAVSINTGIPSSGQISLSQFYGAETP
jgi:hypothetical protein